MRIRLKTKFFFAGHLHEPGDIVDLPENVEGPYGSRQITHDRIDYDAANGIDANRLLGQVDRVPLFDVVDADGNPVSETKGESK